jgi:hypothetical protein
MIAGARSIPPGGNSLSVVQSGRMTSRAEHLRASTPESWKRFSLARGSWRTSRPLSTPGSRHYRHGYFDPDPTTLGGRFSRVDSWVRARRQGCLARAKRSSRDRFVETRRSLQVREPPPHAVDTPEWRIANQQQQRGAATTPLPGVTIGRPRPTDPTRYEISDNENRFSSLISLHWRCCRFPPFRRCFQSVPVSWTSRGKRTVHQRAKIQMSREYDGKLAGRRS